MDGYFFEINSEVVKAENLLFTSSGNAATAVGSGPTFVPAAQSRDALDTLLLPKPTNFERGSPSVEASMISPYMNSSETFDDTICERAAESANHNERD